MTKNAANTRQKNGAHKTSHPYSNKDHQLFFNHHSSHSSGIKKQEKQKGTTAHPRNQIGNTY
ncbi:hypothetical protein [Legionella longbeachae]|uniref:hypothetical protein n=1 Tax=Legionella longbeachae TaxID=450 RepID=UPI0001BEBF92|nr:hypothetical protein [Legionella longbeachae]EEZ97159.1 conserved hypothetical protein [Legionella longbeachae D-4968]